MRACIDSGDARASCLRQTRSWLGILVPDVCSCVQILMTKPMVTAVNSKSDFMFKNASNYDEEHVLCLASASTWNFFDNYMLPIADKPIKVSM